MAIKAANILKKKGSGKSDKKTSIADWIGTRRKGLKKSTNKVKGGQKDGEDEEE